MKSIFSEAKPDKNDRVTQKKLNVSLSIFEQLEDKALKYQLYKVVKNIKARKKTPEDKQIDSICSDITRSVNESKQSAFLKLMQLVGGNFMVRFLPSSSEDNSKGKSIYMHSGYYNKTMTLSDAMAIQLARKHCRCGLERAE